MVLSDFAGRTAHGTSRTSFAGSSYPIADLRDLSTTINRKGRSSNDL